VPEKGNGRKQVLANMTPSPGADTNWIKIALQKSAKTSAVSSMMKQEYDDSQTKVAKPKGQAAAVTASKKRKAQPKKSKEGKTKQTPAPISKDTTNTPRIAEETVIRRCGCRHGDLSAIKVLPRLAQSITSVQTSSWRAEVVLIVSWR
jgi:hypothetical protein